jgi:hypothetical protein
MPRICLIPTFSRRFVSSFHFPSSIPCAVNLCQCHDQSSSSILLAHMFCNRTSSLVSHVLSRLVFVRGLTGGFVAWPIILGIFSISWGLIHLGLGYCVVGVSWTGLCKCSDEKNNEEKSYASSKFTGGTWSRDFNSTNGDINSSTSMLVSKLIVCACEVICSDHWPWALISSNFYISECSDGLF